MPADPDRKPSFKLFQIRTQKIYPQIPVYLPHNLSTLDLAALLPVSPAPPSFGFPALENWITRLLQNFTLQESDPSHPFQKHPYKLRELEIQAVDWFWRDVPGKEDKLGFMKIQAKIETDPYVHDGEEKERADWLPGAVFLRGGSVGMLIILQPSDAPHDTEKHVLLTLQPRIAASSLSFTEIPAGMLDASSFRGTAASEIREEAHLTVREDELINMSELALSPSSSSSSTPSSSTQSENIETAMYPSPGACDEFIPLFLCQKRLTRRHMEWLKGKATGLRDEGENITLRLVRLEEVWKVGGRDAKTLAALALYNGLKGEGKIPGMPEEVEKEPEEVK